MVWVFRVAGGGLSVVPWVVSGKSGEALAGQAGRLLEFVGGDEQLDPVDVGWSLVAGRSVFEHRAVVVGGDRGELMRGLGVVAGGGSGVGVVGGRADVVGKTVFVFSGAGSQWVGMGVELLEASPVFAAADAGVVRRRWRQFVDWSLLDVLRGVAGAPGLDRVDVVQPVLFAVMVSLAQVWGSVGVVPDAVIGHSQGEIAAAYVAGVLSLEDAARLVAVRSRLLVALARCGGDGVVGVWG